MFRRRMLLLDQDDFAWAFGVGVGVEEPITNHIALRASSGKMIAAMTAGSGKRLGVVARSGNRIVIGG